MIVKWPVLSQGLPVEHVMPTRSCLLNILFFKKLVSFLQCKALASSIIWICRHTFWAKITGIIKAILGTHLSSDKWLFCGKAMPTIDSLLGNGQISTVAILILGKYPPHALKTKNMSPTTKVCYLHLAIVLFYQHVSLSCRKGSSKEQLRKFADRAKRQW